MDFAGKKLSRYTGTVHIMREQGDELTDLQIKVRQLPLDWQEECEIQLPPPEAPIVGKEFDKQGVATPKRDYEDAEFVKAGRKWEHATWAKKIHDATIDERITWEADKGLLASSPAAYYEAIYQELSACFSRQEIAQWLLTINSIDQVAGADIALAEESLFRFVLGSPAVSKLEGNEDERRTEPDLDLP